MKILYSCLSKSWGGMEMVAVDYARRLLNAGIEVDYLAYNNSNIHEELKKCAIKVYTLNSSGYFRPFELNKVIITINKNNYDLIHTHYSKDLWILVPALKTLKNSIVLLLTKHVGSFISKKDYLHKILYNRVNRILAISNIIKKNLLETCPVNNEQIKLFHTGVDLNTFIPQNVSRERLRKEFQIKEDDIVFGMTARFSPGKGHEIFLNAAAELNKVYKNLKYLIIGKASFGEENYHKKIIELSKSLGLENSILFTGYRQDIADLLSVMDIFVFPSHNEAFGIALLEAMAMGKPSVCTGSDGILDIAVEHETSLLFERSNGAELKSKMEQLLLSQSLREQLGINARERVEKYFDLNDKVKELIKIYEEEISEINKLK